jgi:hypothetical protein
MAVSAPFDILELRAEGELITRVTGLDTGPVAITTRDNRPPKVVQAVRLFVPPEDKLTEPPYWDVTAQSVRPALLTLGPLAITQKRYLKLHKYGDGAGARFSAELLPVDYSGGPRADTKNMAGP